MIKKQFYMGFAGFITIIELFFLMCLGLLLKNHEIIPVLISVCYDITVLSYAIKLYTLEEK